MVVLETPSLNGTFIGKGPHILQVPVQTISKLAPFSALIISVILVIYFIVRYYVLELFLLKKIYGETYTRMNDTVRRGFVNHHIAGATKVLILIIAAYPFIDVAFGRANFHTPFAGSKMVTLGDVLIIAGMCLGRPNCYLMISHKLTLESQIVKSTPSPDHAQFIGQSLIPPSMTAQMLIAMYIFELFYRPKVSPVSVGHHVGTIIIGQAAIAISLELVRERDATIEFILCTVWGEIPAFFKCIHR